MAKGKIVKVSGPVVDVEFPETLPAIYNALTVEFKVKDQPAKVTLEVQQDLGDNVVRTISMAGTEGLKRGFEVLSHPSSAPAARRPGNISPIAHHRNQGYRSHMPFLEGRQSRSIRWRRCREDRRHYGTDQ